MTNIESTDLPALQPRTQCVLIARDPNFIYAYWNYTEDDINRLRNQLKFEGEELQLILRVYDISQINFNGSNANHTWDLDVGFSVKDWYVHVWQDNAEYCAELGVHGGENHFIPLMRSNSVRTPSKTASHRNDLIWQDIKSHRESKPYLKENIRERYQNLIQQHSKKALRKAKLSRKARVYQLTAQDIRDYYRKLFARVSPRGKLRFQERMIASSMGNILKGKWGEILWQKVQPLVVSPELLSAQKTQHGASMEFLENKGASENLSSLQSQASEGRLSKRKFFFEVWAELIVYGRTEPDAAVKLNENGVKLNPDGTFLMRYALPDGRIPFNFIAQSSDGVEQRHIDTHVERAKTTEFLKISNDNDG